MSRDRLDGNDAFKKALRLLSSEGLKPGGSNYISERYIQKGWEDHSEVTSGKGLAAHNVAALFSFLKNNLEINDV